MPYTLRTTLASHLAEAGLPMFQLAKLLGHKNATTAAKHYAKKVGNEAFAHKALLGQLYGEVRD